MRPPRRILGVLEHVHAVRDGARCGVVLGFRARRPELPDRRLARPPRRGAGRGGARPGLLRLLREARLSAAGAWLGEPDAAARRLARALGREPRLEVIPRSRVRFEAFTEHGTLSVADVAEVVADETSFLVRRLGPHARLIARARLCCPPLAPRHPRWPIRS